MIKEEKKDKLIKILENNSVEIIFNYRIPYLCMGTNDEYGFIDTISIGDNNITGYNGICKENLSQNTMNKIKLSIIEILKSEN